METSRKLRIAIVGGGLAGATLINALLKHEHLSVDIFESAPEFSERGAAVGLSQNAQRALLEIGQPVADCLDRAGAVQMNSSRLAIGSGSGAGTVIMDLAPENQGKVVHRAALLAELLKLVPRDRMHTGKRLKQIEETSEGGVTLFWEDGMQFECDAVIGADGVRGFTRSYVVGQDSSAVEAKYAGFWDCRALVPVEKARGVLGADLIVEGEERQYGWVGDGGFFMHDVLDNGKTVQCVASVFEPDDWSDEKANRKLTREALQNAFGHWNNSPVKDGLIELLLTNSELKAYPQVHHLEPIPTYTKNRVCLVGDAAHASTPWQGAGAGQAIEDAMILDAVLGQVTEPYQLAAAFEAYETIRRPRAHRIVVSSQEVGRIICGRGEDIGLDVDKMRAALGERWVLIHTLDQKEHKKRALDALRDALSRWT